MEALSSAAPNPIFSPISTAPAEILLTIFQFAISSTTAYGDFKSYMAIRLSCRQWRIISQDESLYIPFLLNSKRLPYPLVSEMTPTLLNSAKGRSYTAFLLHQIALSQPSQLEPFLSKVELCDFSKLENHAIQKILSVIQQRRDEIKSELNWPKLKVLRVPRQREPDHDLAKIFAETPKLTRIDLSRSFFSDSELAQFFISNPELEVVRLSHMETSLMVSLEKDLKLNHLSLYGCNKFKRRELATLLMRCPSLRYLDLSYIGEKETLLALMDVDLPHLNTLCAVHASFTKCETEEILKKFPKLRQLNLAYSSIGKDELELLGQRTSVTISTNPDNLFISPNLWSQESGSP